MIGSTSPAPAGYLKDSRMLHWGGVSGIPALLPYLNDKRNINLLIPWATRAFISTFAPLKLKKFVAWKADDSFYESTFQRLNLSTTLWISEI